MKHKTAELDGALLNAAVAKAEGHGEVARDRLAFLFQFMVGNVGGFGHVGMQRPD